MAGERKPKARTRKKLKATKNESSLHRVKLKSFTVLVTAVVAVVLFSVVTFSLVFFFPYSSRCFVSDGADWACGPRLRCETKRGSARPSHRGAANAGWPREMLTTGWPERRTLVARPSPPTQPTVVRDPTGEPARAAARCAAARDLSLRGAHSSAPARRRSVTDAHNNGGFECTALRPEARRTGAVGVAARALTRLSVLAVWRRAVGPPSPGTPLGSTRRSSLRSPHRPGPTARSQHAVAVAIALHPHAATPTSRQCGPPAPPCTAVAR